MRFLIALLLTCLSAQAAFLTSSADVNAQKWQNMVKTNGGTLSANANRAGTYFARYHKGWGLNGYVLRANIYVGNNTNAMVCPIVHDWFDTVDTVDSLVAFASGDFNESTGLTGNTTSKYLKVNGFGGLTFDISGHTVATNIHLATYVRTGTNENTWCMGIEGTGATANDYYYLAVAAADLTHSRMGDITHLASFNDTNGVGFYFTERRATTFLALYKNGVAQNTNTTSDTRSIPATFMVVHALNTTGTLQLWTSRTLSYYGLGIVVPDARKKSYNDLVQGVQKIMGRKVN